MFVMSAKYQNIPNCIWTLSSLSTLHIAGNTYDDMLPPDGSEGLTLGRTVTAFNAAYNNFAGSIPAYVSNGNFSEFDMASNR